MHRQCAIVAILLTVASLAGCGPVAKIAGGTWHQKFQWKAEDYFDDAQVIALCKAIEKNDIAEIDRLVTAGANVNAQGKGKMTPLLWAFPDNKLERFKRLLEHGADPNVMVESDFNTRAVIMSGDSVTHMACATEFPGYFEAVFAHGGDPNMLKSTKRARNQTPIFTTLQGRAPEKIKKVKFLIDQGVDLNHIDGMGYTPAMGALGQFNLARMILEAGADPRAYHADQIQRLIHILARRGRERQGWSPELRQDFDALVQCLEDHGESLQAAKEDIKRWDSFSGEEFRKKVDSEIAERKRRERQEKKAAAPAPQDQPVNPD